VRRRENIKINHKNAEIATGVGHEDAERLIAKGRTLTL
jgi:hypothetical protein